MKKKFIYKDNIIIKPYLNSDAHDHHSIQDWFEYYKSYADFEPRAVKVFSINPSKNNFAMENLKGFSLDKHDKLARLTNEEHRFILSELGLIFSNFFKFKNLNIPDNRMFLHMDIHVGNLMYTEDKEVKLIDPDSCFISVINEPRNITFYGKYVDTLLYLREFLRK